MPAMTTPRTAEPAPPAAALDPQACFEAHRARVYRWALALGGQHADALDAVQEVFLRLLRTRPELRGAGQTLAWLRRTTASVAIDRWRRAGRDPPAATPRIAAPPEQALAAEERRAAVRAALLELSEQQRLVIMCKCYDELTFEATAAELGIAVPTAKTHYLRGLAAIRARLAHGEEEARP